MNQIVLIGIDDTDVIDSTGTGRMARELTGYLVQLGMGSPLGVTRHQLLVDERIPYTSHNSSLCTGLLTDRPVAEFRQPCIDFLKANFREGSDPGLCICRPEDLKEEVIDFGLKAQKEVLTKKQAAALAAEKDIFLAELGGTGGGIIGALAGAALRAEGNSGRYVDLPGIRSIEGTVSVSELLARTDIDSVQNEQGALLGKDSLVDSRDWVRPSLVKGKPVLRVRLKSPDNGDKIWTSVELREREKA
jgi:hypothetical protein